MEGVLGGEVFFSFLFLFLCSQNKNTLFFALPLPSHPSMRPSPGAQHPPSPRGGGGGAARGAPRPSDTPRRRPHAAPPPPPPPPRPPVRGARDTCYGCGTPLQTIDPDALGYVDADALAVKAARRQRGMLACARCRALAHGALVPGVAEPWSKQETEAVQAGGLVGRDTSALAPRRLATPTELRSQLLGLDDRAILAVMVVDMLDVPGSILARVRDLVGRNPVFLVGTRSDLLPTDAASAPLLADWLAAAAARRKLNVAGAAIVSSRSGEGVPHAAASLRRARAGRDVVVVGAANVGKSAFVRAFVKDMAAFDSPQFDAAAAAVAKRLPVASAVPGTTLGVIPLAAFEGGGALCDTPGLHLEHRLIHTLTPVEVKAMQPGGPLKSVRADPPTSAGASYTWGGVARLDFEPGAEAGGITSVSFVGPAALAVERRAFGESGGGDAAAAAPAFGAASVAARGGLRPARSLSLRGAGGVDVSVSGLPGWVEVRGRSIDGAAVTVWAPTGVEVFVRPPVPRK